MSTTNITERLLPSIPETASYFETVLEESCELPENLRFSFEAYLLDEDMPLFRPQHYADLPCHSPCTTPEDCKKVFDNFDTSVTIFWLSGLDSKPHFHALVLSEIATAHNAALESHGRVPATEEARLAEMQSLFRRLKRSVASKWGNNVAGPDEVWLKEAGWSDNSHSQRSIECRLTPKEGDFHLPQEFDRDSDSEGDAAVLFHHSIMLNSLPSDQHHRTQPPDDLDTINEPDLDSYFKTPRRATQVATPWQLRIPPIYTDTGPFTEPSKLTLLNHECLPTLAAIFNGMVEEGDLFSLETVGLWTELQNVAGIAQGSTDPNEPADPADSYAELLAQTDPPRFITSSEASGVQAGNDPTKGQTPAEVFDMVFGSGRSSFEVESNHSKDGQ